MIGSGFAKARAMRIFTSLLLVGGMTSGCRPFRSADLVVRPEPAPEPLIVTPFPAPVPGAVTASRHRQPPPVLVIDGVRVEGEARRERMMNDLDSSEIERIEILKGPAAAERFPDDSEAQAVGVIVIYTKRESSRG